MRTVSRCFAALFACFIFYPASLAFAQNVQVTLRDGSIEPSQIEATKGQPVHVFVRNQGTNVHNFVVPDFYVFTQNLQPGESVNVSFTPDKTGTYPYYSDKKGVPEPGMEGQLQIR